MSNVDKFSNVAEVYSRYRPKYSEECIDYLVNKCSLDNDSLITDIGSGTGILSRQFLNRNIKVISIEPNKNMRDISVRELSEFNNSIIMDSTAEDTRLDSNSIDLVLAGQSFHWFDKKLFLEECKRILKINGLVAILYNTSSKDNELIKERDEIIQRFCPRYVGVNGGILRDMKVFDTFFCNYELEVFNNYMEFDLDRFLGYNCSATYSLNINDICYNEYIDELTRLFNAYSTNGTVNYPFNTACRLGAVKKKV